MKELITATIEDDLAVMHLNDTEGRNLFSDAFIDSLLRALDKVEKANPKVLLIKGLEDIFCAGADQGTLKALSEGEMSVKDLLVSERLIQLPFPVISAMEGHAVGGGLVIGMCSDIVLAALESRYGVVFMNMGFTPGMGTTTLIQGLMGEYVSNEMMFTGKRFKGKELKEKATQINYILPKSEVLPKAFDIARQITEKNEESIYLLKYALSSKKKKLLIDARLNEDMMHKISFASPKTKAMIKEFYVKQ